MKPKRRMRRTRKSSNSEIASSSRARQGGKRPRDTRSRSQQRRDAEKFLWHLEEPWKQVFSHQHWWYKDPKTKGKDSSSGKWKRESPALIGNIPDESVVWEMFRRHPETQYLNRECIRAIKQVKSFESLVDEYGVRDTALTSSSTLIRGRWDKNNRR